ncbi:MAG: hypothetical protein C0424_10785 [Sphingobacteriaceae bacterium]|nr:hypothetical protein [Sphingobacteriaceae bacterium]
MNSSPLLIALLGYVGVMITLLILWAAFANFKRLARLIANRKLAPAQQAAARQDIAADEIAAIAAAIYQLRALEHDAESGILTIKRIKNTYSPWSSKFQGLRAFRNRL